MSGFFGQKQQNQDIHQNSSEPKKPVKFLKMKRMTQIDDSLLILNQKMSLNVTFSVPALEVCDFLEQSEKYKLRAALSAIPLSIQAFEQYYNFVQNEASAKYKTFMIKSMQILYDLINLPNLIKIEQMKLHRYIIQNFRDKFIIQHKEFDQNLQNCNTKSLDPYMFQPETMNHLEERVCRIAKNCQEIVGPDQDKDQLAANKSLIVKMTKQIISQSKKKMDEMLDCKVVNPFKTVSIDKQFLNCQQPFSYYFDFLKTKICEGYQDLLKQHNRIKEQISNFLQGSIKQYHNLTQVNSEQILTTSNQSLQNKDPHYISLLNRSLLNAEGHAQNSFRTKISQNSLIPICSSTSNIPTSVAKNKKQSKSLYFSTTAIFVQEDKKQRIPINKKLIDGDFEFLLFGHIESNINEIFECKINESEYDPDCDPFNCFTDNSTLSHNSEVDTASQIACQFGFLFQDNCNFFSQWYTDMNQQLYIDTNPQQLISILDCKKENYFQKDKNFYQIQNCCVYQNSVNQTQFSRDINLSDEVINSENENERCQNIFKKQNLFRKESNQYCLRDSIATLFALRKKNKLKTIFPKYKHHKAGFQNTNSNQCSYDHVQRVSSRRQPQGNESLFEQRNNDNIVIEREQYIKKYRQLKNKNMQQLQETVNKKPVLIKQKSYSMFCKLSYNWKKNKGALEQNTYCDQKQIYRYGIKILKNLSHYSAQQNNSEQSTFANLNFVDAERYQNLNKFFFYYFKQRYYRQNNSVKQLSDIPIFMSTQTAEQFMSAKVIKRVLSLMKKYPFFIIWGHDIFIYQRKKLKQKTISKIKICSFSQPILPHKFLFEVRKRYSQISAQPNNYSLQQQIDYSFTKFINLLDPPFFFKLKQNKFLEQVYFRIEYVYEILYSSHNGINSCDNCLLAIQNGKLRAEEIINQLSGQISIHEKNP